MGSMRPEQYVVIKGQYYQVVNTFPDGDLVVCLIGTDGFVGNPFIYTPPKKAKRNAPKKKATRRRHRGPTLYPLNTRYGDLRTKKRSR